MRPGAEGLRFPVVAVLVCGLLLLVGCGDDGEPVEAAELRVHALAQGLYVDLLFVDAQPEPEDGDDAPPPEDPDEPEQPPPGRPDPEGEPGPSPPIVRATDPGAAPRQTAGLPARFGPEPEVHLTGALQERVDDQLAHIAVAVPSLARPGVDEIEVEVEGDRRAGGGAEARAVATEASLGGLVVARAEATCEASDGREEGTVALEGVEVLGEQVDTEQLEPGTQLTDVDLPGLADDVTITFNEQETVVRGGVPMLEVTAVHVRTAEGGTSDTDGEMWLARTSCGVR